MGNLCADRTEILLHSFLALVFGEGVAVVELVENLPRIFARIEIDNDEVEIFWYTELFDINSISIKDHHDGSVSVSASLIHPAASRRRRYFAEVRELHLAANRHLEVVHTIEGAGGKHTDCRTG